MRMPLIIALRDRRAPSPPSPRPDEGRAAGRGAESPRRGAGEPLQRRCARRIWELDPADLALVTGVLLGREEVESLLDPTGRRGHAGAREDALRVRLLLGCTVPCAVAEAVEHALDRQTGELQATIERCPMMQLADWWSGERDRMSGEELAAFLWRLACDPRPQLEPLVSRVAGHLQLRAMQLLRDEPDARSFRERSALAAAG